MEKEKTGESLDTLKKEIIIPSTADLIERNANSWHDLSVFDYGSGDSSSLIGMMEILGSRGFSFKNISICDIKQECVGNSILNLCNNGLAEDPDLSINYIENYSDDWTRLNILENLSLDLIISQNTFHQIQNNVELQSFITRSVRFLKKDGIFVWTDLNPEYIEWLAINEESKLRKIKREKGKVVSAEYLFDSGGSSILKNRRVDQIMTMFLLSGFTLSEIEYIGVDKVKDVKERYKKLVDSKVPMFVSAVFKRDEKSLNSYVEGNVRNVKDVEGGIILTLSDMEEIVIPLLKGEKKIKKGDEIIMVETHLKHKEKVVPYALVIVFPNGNREGAWTTCLTFFPEKRA